MKKKLLIGALALPISLIVHASIVYGLTEEEELGKFMFEDTNFSYNGTQSCQTCHDPASGFADPTNSAEPYKVFVSTGDDGYSEGGRNAPTAAYAGYSPLLHKKKGKWHGGLFWDGRADGTVTGDTLADQAQGPPLNPVEMNSTKEAVVEAVINSTYSDLFMEVYGPYSLDDVEEAYNLISLAIAAYERSPEVQKYSSKFDTGDIRGEELDGEAIFRVNCTGCHSMAKISGPKPLFTSYGYANIGIPANPYVVLEEPDPGLGAIVDDSKEYGKFKIPTLRNIDKTAPYGHNGYFPTLESIVDFHNTRDVDETWDSPEYNDNLSYEVGDLGLSNDDVNALVAFLKTLTDL